MYHQANEQGLISLIGGGWRTSRAISSTDMEEDDASSKETPVDIQVTEEMMRDLLDKVPQEAKKGIKKKG